MVDAFEFHLKQLIQMKVRSIVLTVVFLLAISGGLYFLYPTNLQQVIISIYTVLVFVGLLLFIHHVRILRYFLQIRRMSNIDRETTVDLFHLRLSEAKELRTHFFLKSLAYHFIEAYWAYQTVTD